MPVMALKYIVVLTAFGVVTSVVIGVSAYFAAQGDNSEQKTDSRLSDAALYRELQHADPDLTASVVLLRPPWSGDLNNAGSQSYTDIVTSIQHSVDKIFFSSSLTSCFNFSQAVNLTKRGESVQVSLELHVACNNVTAADAMKAFDEGYAFLLLTKDNSRMASINSGTFDAVLITRTPATSATTTAATTITTTTTSTTTTTTTTTTPDTTTRARDQVR